MFSCLSSQRYNFLKANHNMPEHSNLRVKVVYQVKDTIFWKQITTDFLVNIVSAALFIKSKIQFFESKSQHNTALAYHLAVVYQVKDTIFWKQITTKSFDIVIEKELFIKSKIQFFESKSQHMWYARVRVPCCLSSQRYNFLKANHNGSDSPNPTENVVYQVKDTIFWKQITTHGIFGQH